MMKKRETKNNIEREGVGRDRGEAGAKGGSTWRNVKFTFNL